MRIYVYRHRLKLFILFQICCSVYFNRKWLKGLYTTLKQSILFHFKRKILPALSAPYGEEEGDRTLPYRVETFTCSDGEEAVLYHFRETRTSRRDSIQKNAIESAAAKKTTSETTTTTTGKKLANNNKNQEGKKIHKPQQQYKDDVWIVLPGGMTHGDKFYVHDCIASGVLDDGEDPERRLSPSSSPPRFGSPAIRVFHNPGIANTVKRNAPPGLTDTRYLEEYVRHLRERGHRVSLIGFSAGGMLAIAATKLNPMETGERLLSRVVAVHCPDRIRDVFETHQSGWIRLDRIFALSLFLTMLRSGSSDVLSRKRGGGFRRDPTVLLSALYFGWSWMKKFTERVFEQHWYDMENDLWSCRDAMTCPVKTPLLRIISRNDPIVWTRNCVDPSLFCNISKVIVQNDGGHCAAFVDRDVVKETKRWLRAHAGCGEEEDNGCDDADCEKRDDTRRGPRLVGCSS
eukprot:g2031.t1